jgi:hypothetical protein
MRRREIAIACCRRTVESQYSDLYPNSEAGPLRLALEALGASVRLVSWDDPTLSWERLDRIVVSSTWDSVDRPADYLVWADHVASLSTIVNPVSVFGWGLDKTHQRALAEYGVPTTSTTWVESGWAGVEPAQPLLRGKTSRLGWRTRHGPLEPQRSGSSRGAH